MKIFDEKHSITKNIKDILQNAKSDDELLKTFTNVFKNFQNSKTDKERLALLSEIKEYLKLLDPKHLDAVQQVVGILSEDTGLTSLPIDKNKKKNPLENLGGLMFVSDSNEGVVFRSSKQTSGQVLTQAITEEKEERDQQKGLTELGRLYRNRQ